MDMKVISIGLLVVFAAVSLFMSWRKRAAFKKLQALMARGRWNEFFKLIDAPFVKASYPAYNLTYFKLNAYLMQGDDAAARRTLKELLESRTSEKQRVDLVVKAFNIYLGWEDRANAQKMLGEIEGWDSERYGDAQHGCRRAYDIVALGKHGYIEEMERELEAAASPMARSSLAYFLSLQYEAAGDAEKAAEYLQRAQEESR